MKYEVDPVEGIADPLPPRPSEIDDAAKEIAIIYSQAAKRGGRVIAAYNLTCVGGGTSPETGEPEFERVECLFLVSEFPDDGEES